MENLRLGERLALAYGAVVALLLALLGVMVVQAGQVRATTEALVGEQAERLALAREWRQNILVNSQRALALGMGATPEMKNFFEAEMKSVTARTSVIQKRFAELETTPEGLAVQARLTEVRQRYLAARGKLMGAAEQGSTATAVAAGQFVDVTKAYVAVADDLVRHQESRQEAMGADTLATLGRASAWFLGVLLACVAVAVLSGWWLTRSLARPLQSVQAVARAIAQGDLTQVIHAPGRAETAELLRTMDEMQQALRRLVGEVRQATDSIGTASHEVASGNADLSARTEQTASSLEQTASSMEQLTTTVRQSADAARTANQLASSAAEVAQRGGTVVQQVVGTMGEIHQASRKISDIIGVIDGIAFQTNILALNAAVEAARAGEQGRGFAVVAGEVRSLAQRSADAAREIKGLIGASVERVESGSALVSQAGTTMEELVQSVRRVADIVGEISAGAADQSQGIGEVNQAVSHLDQMTQQNAALVEQSSAAAESLREQAGRLGTLVSAFRLQG
uniref:methyl-accepting chemotaxis protein n=1 Tax=Ideonella livida TaxID=2707176 RepID=UPI0035C01FA4